MKDFGVQFRINDNLRFEQLAALWAEIKREKDADTARDPSEWVALVPDPVKAHFEWPTSEERSRWLSVRPFTPNAIPNPNQQLGARWDFYRVFESIEEGEYGLLGCDRVSDTVGELRIDTYSYPYGGVGPLIALAEAFGFVILGVNECGRFESREELLGGRSAG